MPISYVLGMAQKHKSSYRYQLSKIEPDKFSRTRVVKIDKSGKEHPITYHVTDRYSSLACTCPSWAFRRRCKHARWVNFWRMQVEAGNLPGDAVTINFEEVRDFYSEDDG